MDSEKIVEPNQENVNMTSEDNPMLIAKVRDDKYHERNKEILAVIRNITKCFKLQDRKSLRLISKDWNDSVCPLLEPTKPLYFSDIPSVNSFLEAMRKTKDFRFDELVLGVCPTEPIVQELFDLFGRKFKRVGIVDSSWKLPFLQKLLQYQIPNVELLSLMINASNFNGLSFEFTYEEIPVLSSLTGLWLDLDSSGFGREGCLKQLVKDLFRITPRLENLALNFNKNTAPLADICHSINVGITKLFLGWELTDDDIHTLINMSWDVTHLRLSLMDDERFSPLALYAILDNFSHSLKRFSNATINGKRTTVPPGSRPYRITTLPTTMERLTELELENVVVHPGLLARLQSLTTFKYRPHAWSDVLETLTLLPDSSPLFKVRTFLIEGLESNSNSAVEAIELIHAAFPHLNSLTIPSCDEVFSAICLHLTEIRELILNGSLTDEGITGFSAAECSRLREGRGAIGDTQSPQIFQESSRRNGNITDLTNLRRFSLRNDSSEDIQIGLTHVGTQYGLLECPNL